MNESIFSPNWYRVADLKPRLRSHAELHRHEYRGDLWFILQDHASGRSHRFSPAAHFVIGRMDGRRTTQELWEAAVEHLGDDAPTQHEVIRLLGQLHASDVLQSDVPPDTAELLGRYERNVEMKWKRRLWSPLAIRIPMLDPERWLSLWMPVVQPLFSRASLLIWLVVVVVAAFLAGSHWQDLTENVADRVLAPHNLILLWLIYPIIKAIHELGHSFAIKRWGGEVHELGVMFLVFMPVPYVDASASSAFRDKRKRMVVSGAGIMVELFLASVALILWVNLEPGVVRTICYNVMLIGGISTLLFNGNPLLRFDGYFIFADAIEIPNLANRSNQYLGYLFKRFGLGASHLEAPPTVPGEPFWFVTYGISAFVYRMFILTVIILFVAEKFFNLGVVLAIWAVATGLLIPTVKSTSKLFTDPQMQTQRLRTFSVLCLLVAGALAPLLWIPAPHVARTEGVIWVPEQSQVRAATAGFVAQLMAEDGAAVEKGQPLLRLADPLLDAHVGVLEARVEELEARVRAELVKDRVRAAMTSQALAVAKLDLERALERRNELIVLSPEDGVLVVPNRDDLKDRYIPQGQLLAYVSNPEAAIIRVLVEQDQVGLVRTRFQGVDAAIADWDVTPQVASVIRFVPAGTFKLPSPALGTSGGGIVPVDPRDPDGLRTLERVFELDLELKLEGAARDLVATRGEGALYIGRRVYVRLDFGYEPMARQWYRDIRQLFLKRFDV